MIKFTYQVTKIISSRLNQAYQEDNVHYRPELGKQPFCAHQKLQRTHKVAGEPLQHSRDKEFVQHPLRWLQVSYVQNARR